MERAAAAGLVLVLGGCGKEIGRIPLHDQGAGETTVQATAGKPLALWTSLDVKYTGQLAAHYEVEALQGGTTVARTQCNPLDVSTKLSSKRIDVGNDHTVSWQGKMHCEVALAKGGATVVRAKLIIDQRPPGLAIRDASLVVKE
jgi:hypothetical protein